MPPAEDEKGALERERERLYAPQAPAPSPRTRLASALRSLPGRWKDVGPIQAPTVQPHHMKVATYFFVGALTFFGLALVVAGYLLYVGGESVSVNNIKLEVQGPSTIAGGDTVPITIAITNRNPVDLQNATLEADFPPGTRSADDITAPLIAYNEDIGTIKSGETITRSIKGVIFGTAGDTLMLPIALSYKVGNSNSTFVKKYAYPLAISSTPLSISVDTIAETTSGKSITITLQVRSNAQVPLDHAVVRGDYPFGFTLTSSSVPAEGSDIPLGTLQPGESKNITLTGTLDGQDGETRVFRFSIGTEGGGAGLAVTYMTQDASVKISAPFLATNLTLNGAPLAQATLAPSAVQDVTVSYTNTLGTNVENATISVTISGGAVDYSSIKVNNGFYDSSTRTIIFSKDTDPGLASLAPGATGVGAFSFTTVPASSFDKSPSVSFTSSVSGTRQGQSNVPEAISAIKTETIKAATAVELVAESLHTAGPFANTGPIPPTHDKATTYTVQWRVANGGSAVAGGVVKATLPSYVEYTNKSSGQGIFSYDAKSRTVTWTAGDVPSGGQKQGAFQVSLTPSSSQVGNQPPLTSEASFTGFDRFAGVDIKATANAVTTETIGDPNYTPANATVQ